MIPFLEIPETFATAMNGKQIGCNVFAAAQPLDGRWVVSPNALHEFPDDFEALEATGWKPEVIELTVDDFAQTEEND